MQASPHSPDQALAEARRRFRNGDSAGARTLLRRLVDDEACARALQENLLAEGHNGPAQELAHQLRDRNSPAGKLATAIAFQLAGQPEHAARRCEQLLQGHDLTRQERAAAWHHLGRALHNLGQRTRALESLRKAVAEDPDYAEAWYSLGHALRANGHLDEACQAYERSLGLMPGLRSAELNLGITRSAMEQPEVALASFERLLRQDPADQEALANAGLALQVMRRYDEAGERYRQALATNPNDAATLQFLGSLQNELGQTREAETSLTRALELDPGNPDIHAELAGMYEQSSRLDQAAELVQRGLKQAPGHPRLTLEAARLDRRSERCEQALGRLQSLDPGSLPLRSAIQYFQEAGLALDRLGETRQAFAAFREAKQIGANSPRSRGVDREAFLRELADIQKWIEASPPGQVSRGDDAGADLCFLVGFPRSGTTLLDTIFDIHPAVDAVEEKPTLEAAIDRLRNQAEGYPAALDALSATALASLRQTYRETVESFRTGRDGSLILDKLPLRFVHAGLIEKLFPDARLIFVQRHPCDVVLSNFMQIYEPNEAMVHFDTLESAARMYARAMDLWWKIDDRLTLNRTYVRYEDLVAEPETALKSICAFLGIEWDPAMLSARQRGAKRERIRTTSYQQVTEAIYGRAVGRWTGYRAFLDPLLPKLAPHIRRMDYSD